MVKGDFARACGRDPDAGRQEHPQPTIVMLNDSEMHVDIVIADRIVDIDSIRSWSASGEAVTFQQVG